MSLKLFYLNFGGKNLLNFFVPTNSSFWPQSLLSLFFWKRFLNCLQKKKKRRKEKKKKRKKKTASSFVLKSLYSKTKFGLWMYDTKTDLFTLKTQFYRSILILVPEFNSLDLVAIASSNAFTDWQTGLIHSILILPLERLQWAFVLSHRSCNFPELIISKSIFLTLIVCR